MSHQETLPDDEAQPQGSLYRWIGLFVLVTAVLAFLRWMSGGPGFIGDALAFSGMILGGLIMMQSQREFRAAGLERVREY